MECVFRKGCGNNWAKIPLREHSDGAPGVGSKGADLLVKVRTTSTRERFSRLFFLAARNERDCLGEFEDGQCLPIGLEARNIPSLLAAFERFGRVDVAGASSALDYDDEEELENSDEGFEFWHVVSTSDPDAPYVIVAGPPDNLP